MATQKVSLTLEAGATERARQAAGPRGLSAYVEAVLQEKLGRDERRQALLALIEEFEVADPPSPEDRERASKRVDRIRAAVER